MIIQVPRSIRLVGLVKWLKHNQRVLHWNGVIGSVTVLDNKTAIDFKKHFDL